MVHKDSSLKKRITRLGQTIKILLEKEVITTSDLSEYFSTHVRTIQRDIALLKESGFPIIEKRKGHYRIDKDIFKSKYDNEFFNETELALIISVKNLVCQLGDPFKKAAGNIFNRLYKSINSIPVYIKIDEPIFLDNIIFGKIIKSIQNKRVILFDYTVHSPYEVRIEPYKVAYFQGFWYLIGLDLKDSKIKSYAIDKIGKIKPTQKKFNIVPDHIDKMLNDSVNVWFSNKQEIKVVLQVNAECAEYFERKKFFPTQEVQKKSSDGSMIISFMVGSLEEVNNFIKVWIPHVKIIKPKELKQEFLGDIKRWIAWQES
ncbi:helix-turn-helix transcriptional regulator [Thermodesulfobacteriota bacterium]